MTYQPVPITEAGGQKRIWSADEETRELLRKILLEIRKLVAHAEIVTGEAIIDGDLED